LRSKLIESVGSKRKFACLLAGERARSVLFKSAAQPTMHCILLMYEEGYKGRTTKPTKD